MEELREAGPVEQEVGGRGKWRPFRASLEAGLNPARVMGVGMCMKRKVLVSGSRRFPWASM